MKNTFLILLLMLNGYLAFADVEKDTIIKFKYNNLEFRTHIMDDCDACGCSASGGSMGFSSMINSNFIGIRYFSQKYTSRDGIFANSPWVDENFNTVQLWTRIPVTERIQVSALVPFHYHDRRLTSGKETIEGLGDITVLAMYTAYQTVKDSTVFTHKLQLGGGVKLPTGKYESANNLGTVNPGFQLGTGSFDYLLVTEYVIQRKQLGLQAMANYTFKTENTKSYQFGNQLNYGSTLFYLLDFDRVKVVPQAGIAGEIYETNKQYDQEVPETSGNVLFGKVGVEAGFDRFSVGFSAMYPMQQNLTGGNVEARSRWSVNLNYSL